jgi:hypothetical protein
MKNKKLILMIPALFLLGCSSLPHNEKTVTKEAKLETPTTDSSETQTKLLEILNQDTNVKDEERKQLISIVEESYNKYKELETLSNQKKALLIRESISKNPDKNKLKAIKNAIKKTYHDRAQVLLDTFEHIAVVMKIHPHSAEAYFGRAGTLWPLKDRAP